VIRIFFLVLVVLANQVGAFEEAKCVTQGKVCIDEKEKNINGFAVKQCWKYKEVLRCISEEFNHCTPFEENRGCNEITGECKDESPTGLCSHYEKKFVCGGTSHENAEVKLVSSEFNVLRDEKDLEKCDPQIKDKYCEIAEEECVEPAETRNISGKDIYKECWKWSRKYQCRTDTFIDECKGLREKGCKEIKRECVYQEEGRCDHYTISYECEKKTTEKIDCIASNFCVGEVCREQERNRNEGFGQAASYLGVLSQMNKDQESCSCNKEKDPTCVAGDVDENKCTLFKGKSGVCRRYTGEFDCCADNGFIRDLVGCEGTEQDLSSKQQAGVCTFVGSWRGGGVLAKFKMHKSYCCFNSKLARIIQEQGRQQLGRGFENPNADSRYPAKYPDCDPLSLSEIKKIDFSKMDFSELYADLKVKAQKDFKASSQDISKKLKGYQENPEELASMIKGKMGKFYGK
jgi:conjugal transfer mating pair stabilization protein TraN